MTTKTHVQNMFPSYRVFYNRRKTPSNDLLARDYLIDGRLVRIRTYDTLVDGQRILAWCYA